MMMGMHPTHFHVCLINAICGRDWHASFYTSIYRLNRSNMGKPYWRANFGMYSKLSETPATVAVLKTQLCLNWLPSNRKLPANQVHVQLMKENAKDTKANGFSLLLLFLLNFLIVWTESIVMSCLLRPLSEASFMYTNNPVASELSLFYTTRLFNLNHLIFDQYQGSQT